MGINVNAAISQAAQLDNNVLQLQNAKKQMLAYKSSVSSNWQAVEVGYITSAIDQVVFEIDDVIRNIDSLSSDIKSIAVQIKREEEAAAKQQRIRLARSTYNTAYQELRELVTKKETLEKQQRNSTFIGKLGFVDEIQSLNKKIEQAEKNCQNAYNALRAAER